MTTCQATARMIESITENIKQDEEIIKVICKNLSAIMNKKGIDGEF